MNQPMPPGGPGQGPQYQVPQSGEPTAAIPSVPGQPPSVPGQPPGPPGQPVAGPGPQVPPDPNSGNRGLLIAILAVLGVIVVGGLVVGAFLLGGGSGDPVSVTQSSSTEAPTTSESTTTAPGTSAPTTAVSANPAPVGDVRSQPAGLFCRDLRAKGYSYSAAVDYWRIHGQPDRMDADKDGIPCETVYPQDDVVSYWGDVGIVPDFTYQPIQDLPSGLLCRDLADSGYDTYDALSYYLLWGLPSNMDADGNGIPCETVYSDAQFVWSNADFWLD